MAATTWSTTYKTANLSLSGGNLTATSTTSGTNGVGTNAFVSGPTYCEITMGASLTGSVGVGVCIIPWTGATLGSDANSCVYQKDGTVKINAATLATIATYAAGDRIGIAVDPSNGLIWFRVNNGNWNNDIIANQNPVGAVGGISLATLTSIGNLRFIFVATTVTPNQSCTAKFSAAFTDTPPTGFASIDTIAANAKNGATPKTWSHGEANEARVDPQATNACRATLVGQGANRMFSPAGANLTISGTVKEGATPVAGKIVRLYDSHTGDLIGSTTSAVTTGAFSVKAEGRTEVFAVAFDPTMFDALVFDRLTPV